MQECSHWSEIGTRTHYFLLCQSHSMHRPWSRSWIRAVAKITPNFEASVTSIETPNGFDSQIIETRMHSSRMRTAHSLQYRGSLSRGVCLTETPLDRDPLDRDPPGQRPPWSCDLWCMLEQRPPPWTESQIGVKTLPCRNFVADGNNCVNPCKYYKERGCCFIHV